MSILDRALDRFAFAMIKRMNERSQGRILRAMSEKYDMYHPDWGVMDNQQKAYEQVTWIHIAVSRIAKGVAQVPFKVYTDKGGGIFDEVENHPLISLLNKPNEEVTRLELFEATVGYLMLTGNAYWFLSSGGPGAPTRIQVLRSDRMSIVPGRKRLVDGYVYNVGEHHIPLDIVEVVHFKLFHPRSDYYGLSPIEAAAVAAESDYAQAKWNRNYFSEDKAIPAGMVIVKGTVNKTDFERFKEEWKESYGGRQRKTAIVRANDVDWKNVGFSQKEMEFLASRKFNKQEIFDIYDLPLGATDPSSTEANSVTGLNYFKEYTLWPVCTRLSEKLTQDLLPFWDEKLIGRFDDIRPIDRQLQIKEEEVKRAIRTFDEARALAGLPPLEDPTGLDIGKLPYATVERSTISELLLSQDGDNGGAREAPAEGSGRQPRDRSSAVDDNPANKPKKIRKGKAEKPESAKMIQVFLNGLPLTNEELEDSKAKAIKVMSWIKELKQYEKYIRRRLEGGEKPENIRPFIPDVLPVKGFELLEEQVEAIQTLEDLDEVFENALVLFREDFGDE